MYKIPALDTFHDDFKKEIWDDEGFALAAQAAERWLLGFASKTNPEKSALTKLRLGETGRQDDRLMIALALALCAPSPHTGAILDEFYGFIQKNRADVARYLSYMAHNADPEHHVDIFEAFRSLPQCNLHDFAAGLYQVTINSIMAHAIAWDDLEVFSKCLRSEPGLQKYPIHIALSQFPPNTSSAIYKAYIETEEDEKDLFSFRMVAVRQQLDKHYTNGITRLWEPQGGLEKLVMLEKTSLDILWIPELMAVLPPHKTPGFAEAVHKDAYRVIRETFPYRPDTLKINAANWPVVDDLTQSFLDAGITPHQLVSHGACGQQEMVSLDKAIATLGTMNHDNLRFYQVAYRAYLSDQAPADIIVSANTPEKLLAVYRITGDKVFLQAGNHQVREKAMGSDLGL